MTGVKVLVTGATGFVGRHTVAALLNAGMAVRAVSRDAARAQQMPWFAQVEWVGADLHAEDVDVAALTEGTQALVHLAWPGLPNYHGLFHLERNLPADYRFIKAAVAAGVGQVMVAGTCFEYGMGNGQLAEDTAAQPANAYGSAKHSLHLFLLALQRQLPFTLQWPRLFYLHGEGQNPNSLLASLDRAIDAGQGSFDMSAGDQLRDFLPVESAARYLVEILAKPTFDGVVNVCSGSPVSVRGLVEAHLAARGASLRLNLGHYGYPQYEPMAFWGCSRRLKNLLANPVPLSQ
jgi:dTDP-6-deoxy-L-talose 4-dehydrogenase (NAD+)